MDRRKESNQNGIMITIDTEALKKDINETNVLMDIHSLAMPEKLALKGLVDACQELVAVLEDKGKVTVHKETEDAEVS